MISPLFRLALRSLSYHRIRSLVLMACIALVGVLPTAVEGLLDLYRERLEARAVSTPLVIGAPGSRSDLLIHSLYFRGAVERTIQMNEARIVAESGYATPVPVHLMGSVRDHPLVGTTPDYESFRSFRFQAGRWPQKLACQYRSGSSAELFRSRRLFKMELGPFVSKCAPLP